MAAGSVRPFDCATCVQHKGYFLPFAVLEGFSDMETDSKRAKLLALTELGIGKIRCIQYTGATKDILALLAAALTELGYLPVSKKGFLYAEGSVPVLLVAQLDTVHKQSVTHICYSEDGPVMMSPEGIGGADRWGVYMIMEIIKQARCHVLFTEDEEIGCIGARDFVKSKIRPQVNYIVEVDRRGSNDAVFYQCDNPEFGGFWESSSRSKWLMPLPEEAVLVMSGCETTDTGFHLIVKYWTAQYPPVLPGSFALCPFLCGCG